MFVYTGFWKIGLVKQTWFHDLMKLQVWLIKILVLV